MLEGSLELSLVAGEPVPVGHVMYPPANPSARSFPPATVHMAPHVCHHMAWHTQRSFLEPGQHVTWGEISMPALGR